jgi:hypothetical protein
LLSVLYFLSQSVEPPAPDVQAGVVTVTEDKDGRHSEGGGYEVILWRGREFGRNEIREARERS